MEKKTKKRLLTGLIITVVVLTILAGGVYLAVNFVFSKVSDTVGESIGGETINLPTINEDQSIVPDGMTVTLDAESIKKLEEKIPISEKLKVLALLAQHLTSEDYSLLLSYYTSGDVNNDKVAAAYNLMKEKLGPEEKEIIKNYYAKYMYLLEEEN